MNIVWKIFYHIPLAREGRMADVAGITIKQILSGILLVYQNFFSLFYKDYQGLSNGHGIHVIYVVLFLIIIFKIILTLRFFDISRLNKILYFFALLLLPLAIGFMGILSTIDGIDVHTLTLYSYVFIFVGSIISVDAFRKYCFAKKIEIAIFSVGLEKVLLLYQWISFFIIMWSLIYYIRLDNMAYLKVDFTQRQVDSYLTTLVTQIKSTKGYRDDMKVAVIKPEDYFYDLNDKSMYSKNWYEKVTIYGADWDMSEWITDAHWKFYLEYHCGFAPEYIDDIMDIEEMREVKAMPCYPDDGAVQIINDIVVVNFSDN